MERVLTLLILVATVGCETGFMIANDTDEALLEASIRSPGDSMFGRNLLGSTPLEPGGAVQVSNVECARYDTRVVGEMSGECIQFDVTIFCGSWSITSNTFDNCELEPRGECRITASVDGNALDSMMPEVLSGSRVTLRAEDCGDPLDYEYVWTIGGVDGMELGSGPEYTFDAFTMTTITLLASGPVGRESTASITINLAPTAIVSSISISDFKPVSGETVTLELQTVLDATLVPLMTAHPEVATVDWKIVRLMNFVAADTVVERLGETTSSLVLPPLTFPPAWYQVTAIARNSDGEILSTPAPLQFEVVSQ
ncbi:MAG: hypothetical protein WBG86_04875 [Polyangiales bacterium]